MDFAVLFKKIITLTALVDPFLAAPLFLTATAGMGLAARKTICPASGPDRHDWSDRRWRGRHGGALCRRRLDCGHALCRRHDCASGGPGDGARQGREPDILPALKGGGSFLPPGRLAQGKIQTGGSAGVTPADFSRERLYGR